LPSDSLWSAFTARLRELNQHSKVVVMASVDLLLLVIVVLLSYMLRLSEFALPPQSKLSLYFIAPLVSVVCMFAAGVYRNVSRNFSTHNEIRLLMSQLAVPPLWSLILIGIGTVGFARSVVLIYLILSVLTLVLIRRFAAFIFSEQRVNVPHRERIPVVIYGAGKEGTALADALNRQGRYRPVAFLDTDYTLVGRTANGLKIKPIEELDKVVSKYAPQEVIVAKPNLNRANRRVLVEKLIQKGLVVKVAPALEDITDGRIRISDIRSIRVEDLLGRDPVPPNQSMMHSVIRDQVVIITGAGGSIGSELVRQAAFYSPKKLILIENNEFALFEIHREIESKHLGSSFELVAILADVQTKSKMAQVMQLHAVTTVIHAAAYKHVRLVQENPVSGIQNNVFGTLSVAEAAMENGIECFVLVSTDKAVRPTNIMGASKRVAEMIVQALAAERNHSTKFLMVRFGNVLGSTGSVVPLFKEQIAVGGPVTVTHPDVTRYFMLIPEAAQLVIQACAMAEGGDVFVLDMGEPVNITNLAETMIELAGLTCRTPENPEGDIEIKFVGLKDGEKLYEELELGNDLAPTSNQRILRAREFFLPLKELKKKISFISDSNGKFTEEDYRRRIFELAQMPSEISNRSDLNDDLRTAGV
jgi:FlaA1/EpsC-like NDP-sugar epimerase